MATVAQAYRAARDILLDLHGSYDEAVREFRWYHTGDMASRDAEGCITYVGRADDVCKASDYKISPFELESALIEHPAVLEAAVVPAPAPVRLAVPKAYVALAPGYEADRKTARDILRHTREHLAPYLRIRRLEFFDLPKTVSGKIRESSCAHVNSSSPAHPQTANGATTSSPSCAWTPPLRYWRIAARPMTPQATSGSCSGLLAVSAAAMTNRSRNQCRVSRRHAPRKEIT